MNYAPLTGAKVVLDINVGVNPYAILCRPYGTFCLCGTFSVSYTYAILCRPYGTCPLQMFHGTPIKPKHGTRHKQGFFTSQTRLLCTSKKASFGCKEAFFLWQTRLLFVMARVLLLQLFFLLLHCTLQGPTQTSLEDTSHRGNGCRNQRSSAAQGIKGRHLHLGLITSDGTLPRKRPVRRPLKKVP